MIPRRAQYPHRSLISIPRTHLCSRITLNLGNFCLYLDEESSQVWVGCSTAEHTVAQCTELFGFGSGEYAKGGEASDLMSAAEARWLRYALEKGDDLVILEKQRQSPEHLEGASFFNKAMLVMTLNNLLKTLEDSGEVNIQLAEHSLTKDDAGNFTPKPLENVCFALDPVKNHRRKKAKAAHALTFGAKLDMAKVRVSHNLMIIWRLRLGAGLLLRCEVDGSGTSSGEVPSEGSPPKETPGPTEPSGSTAGPLKRPAAKRAPRKKKDDDAELTSLGPCKGHDDEDQDDVGPANEDDTKKEKKRRSKDDDKKGKKSTRSKKTKTESKGKKSRGKKHDDGMSSSSESESERVGGVSENMLSEALLRAERAEKLAAMQAMILR
eukprot:s3324_g4.t1